ncbi:hypothetical protein V3C99_011782 [Haemonchus contortus]|uniref:Protein quiver n=1 Tax=Haemonchus contortus TaxID=6289 RepID=A0A7I4Y3X7_HAECO
MKDIVSSILLLVQFSPGFCITCYECTSVQGAQCRYTATSCQYGFFGCVKLVAYSGGMDKLGMFQDQDRHTVTMIQGCAILPFGGVDRCEQTSILGYRLLKCVCFNDYCNSSSHFKQFVYLSLLVGMLIFILVI